MSFVVMTDTSSNLPSSKIREHDIKEIAFPYFIKGKTYHCTDTGSFEVTTSQITPQQYMDFYEPLLKDGKDILYICMSSGISGSCSSSQIAAKELLQQYPERRIEIIDSLGASLGEGLLALQASDLRDHNTPLETASAELRESARRMCNVFTVERETLQSVRCHRDGIEHQAYSEGK